MIAEGIDPIKQFEIFMLVDLKLGSIDLSITNATVFKLLAVITVCFGFWLTTRKRGLVPTRLQSIGELSHNFIADMLRDTAGEEGLKFFPFVFTLFFFIFAANMLGMVPYFFTTTSHLAVTGILALAVIILVTFVGFYKNGLRFLRLFLPSGIPWPIMPFLVIIEIISYLSRPLTLAFRLFANMMAGHIMLKLLVLFTAGLLAETGATTLISPLPFLLAIPITALEFLVAFLQAFVFTILTCVYLSDALHPEH